MADIAQLGIAVDSRQVVTANRNLNTFSRTSADTERRVRTATEKMERNFGSLRSSVGLVGGALAGLGGAMVFGSVVRTIADFEQAMSTVKAVSGATEEQFSALTDKAQELGASTRFSATQAAEGMLYLARAGFDANESLASIEDTLNLAQAGALDLGMAADIVSNVMQGFGLQADQAKRSVDVLAYAANNANTNVAQFGDAMKYVAPVAAGVGVDLETAAAAVGALSDAGLQASMAGTGLRRVISELESPTKKSVDIMRSLGVSADDVRVSQVGLVGALEELRKAGIDTGQALEIFGDRGGPAFQVLVNAIPKITELNKELRDSQGYAKKIADEMDDNLNGALLANASAAESVVLSFGELGGSNVLTEGFRGSAAALRGMSENMDVVAKAATVLVTIFGTRLVGALGSSAVAMVQQQAANAATLKSEQDLAGAALRRAQVEDAAAARALRTAKVEFDSLKATNARAFALDNLTRAQVAANTASATAATAQARATEATKAYAKSATAAGVAARGLSGAMALVGGPLGAAVLAATAIYTFRKELGLTSNPAKELAEEVDELTKAIDKSTKASVENGIARYRLDLVGLKRDAAEARQEYERLTAEYNKGVANGPNGPNANIGLGLGLGASRARDTLTKLEADIEARKQSVSELEKVLQGLGKSNEGVNTNTGEGNGKSLGGGAVESAIDKRIQQMREQIALFGDLTNAEEVRISLANGFYGKVSEQQAAQLMGLAREMDAKEALAMQEQRNLEAFEAGNKRDAELRDQQIEQVKQLTEELMTQEERAAAALNSRLELINRNVTDEAQAAELRSRVWQRYVDDYEQGTNRMSAFAEQAARNIQDQLGDTLRDTLSGDFDGILDSWADMLLDMAAQAQAAQLAKFLLGDFGGGGGKGKMGGLLGMGASWLGGALAGGFGGGGVSASTNQSFADAGIGKFGGFFADGGNLGAGKWGIAGEAGPEIIHGPATITPAVAAPAANSAQMRVEVNNYGSPEAVRTEQSQDSDGTQVIRLFVNEFQRDMQQRGPMSRAMQSNFSQLKRSGS